MRLLGLFTDDAHPLPDPVQLAQHGHGLVHMEFDIAAVELGQSPRICWR